MAAGPGENVDINALPGMVRWYSPSHLISTGWRSVVSEIFGQYADQRIMQATIDGFAPGKMQEVVARYDYSDARQLGDGNAVWVDYVADLGDGFDSTYAIASLISAPHLEIEGAGRLPAGKLLIMGGDQVYPYPSRKDYRERFVVPYTLALPATSDGKWRRRLFVLPGNHDWYDGLNSFDFMFCKARFGHDAENRIGGWLCPQHRSYFAIRLPHNWWIWGADIQLAQYLDAGQVLYFESVADAMQQHPTEAPKLILCTAEPTWCKETSTALQGEDNLSHITKIAADAGARICAVIAGDYHHYARYYSEKAGTNFITAGGGGAYSAPTHILKKSRTLSWLGEKIGITLNTKIKNGKSTGKPAVWPSRGTSRRLSLMTLGFPFRYYGFAVCLGIFYWLMTWLYATTEVQANIGGWQATSVGDILIKEAHSLRDIVLVTLMAAAGSVMLGILSLALGVILFLYADPRFGTRVRILMATLHWLGHISLMIALYFAVTWTSEYVIRAVWPVAAPIISYMGVDPEGPVYGLVRRIVIFPLEMIFIGGVAAAFLWGLYLTICCLLGLHSDQAFAAMGIRHFKNFLRLKIEPDKLTVYPIGLRRVPKRQAWRHAKQTGAAGAFEGSAIVPSRPLRPRLIEGPIEIRVGDVKRREPEPAPAV
jgi:hypothetical protein